MATDDQQIRNIGKGLVQVNLRLSRILEVVEAGGGGGRDDTLEILLDLLDAIRLSGEPPPPVVRRWWHGLLPTPPVSADRQAGLALAAEQARARLAALGIRPVDTSGRFDPLVHQAVDVRVTQDPEQHDTVATEHRPGWTRTQGESTTVLRLAHVTVYRHQEP